MGFEIKTEKKGAPFQLNENNEKTPSNSFVSKIKSTSLKTETITKQENILSAVKGGAVGFAIMYSWFDMNVPAGPLIITAAFSATTVAMNYSKITKDFKDGFQKGAVVGMPFWALMTNTSPAFLSASLMVIGTVWGICHAVKEYKKQIGK